MSYDLRPEAVPYSPKTSRDEWIAFFAKKNRRKGGSCVLFLCCFCIVSGGVSQPLDESVYGVDQHSENGDQHNVMAERDPNDDFTNQIAQPRKPLLGMSGEQENTVGDFKNIGKCYDV